MVNVWPIANGKYETYAKLNKKCSCKFTKKQVEKLKVKMKWFLQDGTELINQGKKQIWKLKR